MGADTALGRTVVDALLSRDGEIRAFVSDESVGASLKEQKIKVALGDVSDASHVGAAATRCFTAVLMEAAAHDDRERAFGSDPTSVAQSWLDAIGEAGVRRLIWVGPNAPAVVPVPEYASIDPTGAESSAIGAEVAALDDLAAL